MFLLDQNHPRCIPCSSCLQQLAECSFDLCCQVYTRSCCAAELTAGKILQDKWGRLNAARTNILHQSTSLISTLLSRYNTSALPLTLTGLNLLRFRGGSAMQTTGNDVMIMTIKLNSLDQNKIPNNQVLFLKFCNVHKNMYICT